MTIQATQAESRPPRAADATSAPPSLREGLDLALPVALVAVAVVASLAVPSAPGTAPPPNALPVLIAITIVTIIVVLWLQRGLNDGVRATLLLPLPLYTLYLATAVLGGTACGVVLASVATLYSLIPDSVHGTITWARVATMLRWSAIAAMAMLGAGAVYSLLAATLRVGANPLDGRLLAGFAAMLVALAGVSVSRMLDLGSGAIWSPRSWRAYLFSPAFRFQVLLLTVAPLLPLVQVLDDVETELAWVLFLVPLYAIYYLALVSVRLQERTDELQRTVEALAAARERQAELTGYAALVTRAQEEERRRLARELHDDTAQALVALSRGIDALGTRPVDPPLLPQDRKFLEELGQLTKRTLDGIRRACQNLRPSVLDDLGLAAALDSLVSAMVAQGLPCSYTQAGEPRPCAPEVEVTVYRIAQEALSNALRHACASAVAVELSYSADTLRLVVRDDGVGFDASQDLRGVRASTGAKGSENSSHLGLLGMRERAALIGATLDVASAPGKGTVVRLRAPLVASEASSLATAG
jgi:signal transduction histidine kinase